MTNIPTDQYPNAEQMAYPVQVSNLGGALYPEKGLTKRELFAAMAMQGLLANLPALRKEGFHDGDIDQFAVLRADGLIATLSARKDVTP